ncbi:MAG: hypothetical protein J7K34_05595 [Flavobacteriaceae bacterium]|nr:hypothetical protein [Flavobacteriaceae bacterium]
MNKENTPKDYTDNKIKVYFEVADIDNCLKTIHQSDFAFSLENVEKVNYGFMIIIANQVIPEILRVLLHKNQAVYQVKRMD